MNKSFTSIQNELMEQKHNVTFLHFSMKTFLVPSHHHWLIFQAIVDEVALK